MSSITTTIELWQDILTSPMEQAKDELGYSMPLAKLLCDPSELADEERQAVEYFEAKVLDYAFREWEANTERARMVMAAIAEHRTRRALLWARVKSYQDIKDVASILPKPENSTGRQIAAFYNKHLQTLDEAGVDPTQIARVASREDKVLLNTARALSRAEKEECQPVDRARLVQEIIDDAEILPANELGRKYCNGHELVPCDEIILEDGTRLVTFICADDEQYHTLAKRTSSIRAVYGNVEPAIVWAYREYMKGNK